MFPPFFSFCNIVQIFRSIFFFFFLEMTFFLLRFFFNIKIIDTFYRQRTHSTLAAVMLPVLMTLMVVVLIMVVMVVAIGMAFCYW